MRISFMINKTIKPAENEIIIIKLKLGFLFFNPLSPYTRKNRDRNCKRVPDVSQGVLDPGFLFSIW